MKTYHISDTHFYHKNIIKYTSRKEWCDNVEDMNAHLVKQWNSIVEPGDRVVHHGDFCFGGSGKWLEFLNQLNGNIEIILGNHDPKRIMNWYIALGFTKIYRGVLLVDNVVYSHEPVDLNDYPEGTINVHGHIHDGDGHRDSEIELTDNHYNVSGEVLDFKPILIDEILETHHMRGIET